MADDNTNVQDSQADDPVKKLTFERDSAKAASQRLQKQLDEIKSKLPSDEQLQKWQELEAQQAKIEEDRQRKAGEFDAILKQHEDKFQRDRKALEQQIAEREAKATAAEQELNRSMVASAFGSASDWFGGDTAKTILKPARAHQILGDHVDVQVDQVNGRTVRRVVVKGLDGEIIYDPKTRQPADFVTAIGELIDMLPDKNDILRGSGKTGSGSSGGAMTGPDGRLAINPAMAMKADQFRDPKARQAMKDRMSDAGGLQFGPAWDRAANR
jgi:hypothetical protein